MASDTPGSETGSMQAPKQHTPAELATIHAAMMEELGIGRKDALPLADRGDDPDLTRVVQKTVTNGVGSKWHIDFDDVDSADEELNNIADGQLYRLRRGSAYNGQRQDGGYQGGYTSRGGHSSGGRGGARGNDRGRGHRTDYTASYTTERPMFNDARRGQHPSNHLNSYNREEELHQRILYDSTPQTFFNDARRGVRKHERVEEVLATRSRAQRHAESIEDEDHHKYEDSSRHVPERKKDDRSIRKQQQSVAKLQIPPSNARVERRAARGGGSFFALAHANAFLSHIGMDPIARRSVDPTSKPQADGTDGPDGPDTGQTKSTAANEVKPKHSLASLANRLHNHGNDIEIKHDELEMKVYNTSNNASSFIMESHFHDNNVQVKLEADSAELTSDLTPSQERLPCHVEQVQDKLEFKPSTSTSEIVISQIPDERNLASDLPVRQEVDLDTSHFADIALAEAGKGFQSSALANAPAAQAIATWSSVPDALRARGPVAMRDAKAEIRKDNAPRTTSGEVRVWTISEDRIFTLEVSWDGVTQIVERITNGVFWARSDSIISFQSANDAQLPPVWHMAFKFPYVARNLYDTIDTPNLSLRTAPLTIITPSSASVVGDMPIGDLDSSIGQRNGSRDAKEVFEALMVNENPSHLLEQVTAPMPETSLSSPVEAIKDEQDHVTPLGDDDFMMEDAYDGDINAMENAEGSSIAQGMVAPTSQGPLSSEQQHPPTSDQFASNEADCGQLIDFSSEVDQDEVVESRLENEDMVEAGRPKDILEMSNDEDGPEIAFILRMLNHETPDGFLNSLAIDAESFGVPPASELKLEDWESVPVKLFYESAAKTFVRKAYDSMRAFQAFNEVAADIYATIKSLKVLVLARKQLEEPQQTASTSRPSQQSFEADVEGSALSQSSLLGKFESVDQGKNINDGTDSPMAGVEETLEEHTYVSRNAVVDEKTPEPALVNTSARIVYSNDELLSRRSSAYSVKGRLIDDKYLATNRSRRTPSPTKSEPVVNAPMAVAQSKPLTVVKAPITFAPSKDWQAVGSQGTDMAAWGAILNTPQQKAGTGEPLQSASELESQASTTSISRSRGHTPTNSDCERLSLSMGELQLNADVHKRAEISKEDQDFMKIVPSTESSLEVMLRPRPSSSGTVGQSSLEMASMSQAQLMPSTPTSKQEAGKKVSAGDSLVDGLRQSRSSGYQEQPRINITASNLAQLPKQKGLGASMWATGFGNDEQAVRSYSVASSSGRLSASTATAPVFQPSMSTSSGYTHEPIMSMLPPPIPRYAPMEATVLHPDPFTGELKETTGFLKLIPVVALGSIPRQENELIVQTSYEQMRGFQPRADMLHDRQTSGESSGSDFNFKPQFPSKSPNARGSTSKSEIPDNRRPLSPKRLEDRNVRAQIQARLSNSLAARNMGDSPNRG